MRPLAWLRLAALGGVLALAGCGSALRLFLDLPKRDGRASRAAAPVAGRPASARAQLPPAVIESVGALDSVLSRLPRDHAGGIDWLAADRAGTIRPRAALPDAKDDGAGPSGNDVYPSDGAGPEALFPHSAHVRWLACATCHGGTHLVSGTRPSSENPHAPSSCGRCHGPVAFSIQACERCHTQAKLLAGRQNARPSPPLRLERITSAKDKDFEAAARLYPPASFPHFPHRLRYRCKACHEQTFPLRTDGAPQVQADAHEPGKCGSCHNGKHAFSVTAGTCERCHVAAPAPARTSTAVAGAERPYAPTGRGRAP